MLNVLVVDDSSTMRKILANILKICGFPIENILEASNGEEGLQTLNQEKVDLILTDISMPEMDGETMVSKIQENPQFSQIPVIYVSSESSSERIRQFIESGIGFIHKPFTPENVRETVVFTMEKFISRKQMTRSSAPKQEMPLFLEKDLVYKLFVENLEKLCGLFPSLESPHLSEEESFEAAIFTEFSGTFKGKQVLKIYGNLCDPLTSAMLKEETYSKTQQIDALSEFAHIVCRNILPYIAGPRSNFETKSNTFTQKNLQEFSETCICEAEVPLLNGQINISIWVENVEKDNLVIKPVHH